MAMNVISGIGTPKLATGIFVNHGVDGGHGHGHGRAPFFLEALSLVRRRKWIILGTILASIVLGILVTLVMTPKYTASTTIEIQRESRNFTMVQGAETEERNGVDQEFYQTQYGLLRARSLADRVATELRLDDNAAFFDMFSYAPAGRWFSDGRILASAPSRAERTRAAGEILLDHLALDPQRLSRLVEVRFTSPDAVLSKKVVDAWAVNFIKLTMERRFDATAYARRFLETRLTQLRNRIDESERQLVSYAAREGIVNLPAAQGTASGDAASGERSIIADDLATLNRELSQSTADRVRAESRLGSSGGTVTEALDNPAISGLRQRRAEAAADYAKLMVQFEPDYEPAKALQKQIEQLDSSIAREEGRVRATLQQTYQAAKQREQSLDSEVAGLKRGVLDLRRRSIQYNIYQRDVDTSRQLYDGLLQRFKEIGVAGGVGVNNISVVDDSELPQKPSSPKLLLNLLVAVLLGSLLGIGIAVILEQIDQGISDPADVEKSIGLSLIGTVPMVEDGDTIGALDDRKSFLSEAYTSLRTTLSFATEQGLPRLLGVTSTQPGEGKSTTSLSLAVSVARSGKRVLLVDGDMRSPSMHEFTGVANAVGLSSCLTGNAAIAEAVVATRFENMSVMPAGPQPPSVPELLSSDRFGQVLHELVGLFDYVMVDMPPVIGLADAPLIASRLEGLVYVIEMGRTQRNTARTAIERLRAAHAPIIGAVMTKFNAKRARHGYGYGYDYGYGYAYGDNRAA